MQDVLAIEDVEVPEPTEDRVLVAIKASSVNSWDWDRLRGRPYWGRFDSGWVRPSVPRFGGDFAGVVDSIGPAVTDFRPGDQVMGDLSWFGWGAFAEYVAPRQSVLAPKAAGLTFEQAASLPQAGLLALQSIRLADPQRGESSLVNGAGGGSGTMAIQMLIANGVAVTGVDRGLKEPTIRSLGQISSTTRS